MLKKWFIFSVAVLLLATGCAKKEAVKELKEKETENIGKQAPDVENFPYQSPLTGMGQKEEPNERSVAVMVNNHPSARPQSGLQKADIVYEVLAEGDITRFLAIFQSEKPKTIGPVRSARDYFIELAKGYDSFYVAHGWSPEAKQMLKSNYIDNINGIEYDGSLFKRANFRKAPHNSYISYDNILKGAEKVDAKMNKAPSSLTFLSDEEVEGLAGNQALNASISYSGSSLFYVEYKYDTSKKKYQRFSNGELTADYDTEEPVLLDNIFIVEAEHRYIDNYGRREINLTSGGKGYLLQRGLWNEVQWKNVDGRILPFINGEVAGFVPGKTWINIVPSSPGIDSMVSIKEQ
ncbi:DUF3048 domain-containing protein [Bacillus massilinigeriensis]